MLGCAAHMKSGFRYKIFLHFTIVSSGRESLERRRAHCPRINGVNCATTRSNIFQMIPKGGASLKMREPRKSGMSLRPPKGGGANCSWTALTVMALML